MNRHRRSNRRRTGSAVVAAVMVATSLTFAGAAVAGTSNAKGHSTVYSAAHAQYGKKKVLKPTVSAVAPAKATKPAVKASIVPLRTTKTTGTLPFTGISLIKALLVALGMVALGVILRRQPSRRSNK